jgi:hypothetical protein
MGILDAIKNKAKEMYNKVDSTTNPASARNESWSDVSKRYGATDFAKKHGLARTTDSKSWGQIAVEKKLAGQPHESWREVSKRYGAEIPQPKHSEKSWGELAVQAKLSGQKPESWREVSTRYRLAGQKPESWSEVATRYKLTGQPHESWSEVGQRYGVQSTYGRLKSGANVMGSAISGAASTGVQGVARLGKAGYNRGIQGAVKFGQGAQRVGRYVENRLPQKVQGVNTRGNFLANLSADARGGGRAPPTAHLEVAKNKVMGLYNKQSQYFKPAMSDARKAFGQVLGEGRKVSGTYAEYERRRKLKEQLENVIGRNPELKPYLARQGLYGPVRQSQNMFYPKGRPFRKL